MTEKSINKPFLLILNQYFPPDQAATGQLLGQLANSLTKNFRVTVICGEPTYSPHDQELSPEIKIHRIPLLKKSRSNLFFRILNYLIFMAGGFIQALRTGRQDLVMCWTDPPTVALIACIHKSIFQTPFVFVSQDVYPEVTMAVGKMNFGLSHWILRTISNWTLKKADVVISLGNDMNRRLVEKGCEISKLVTIPNWQDIRNLSPKDKNLFRKKNQLPESSFIVMHSGNIGLSQDFEALLEAARQTKSDKDILYLIAGDGSRAQELREKAKANNLSNIRFLPYQPASQLAESLSSADLHYVSLKPELTGYIVPSKIYGILAVGRPAIVCAAPECSLHEIIAQADCGKACPPERLAEEIRNLKADPETLKKWGQNARNWIQTNHDRETIMQKYSDTLLSVMKTGKEDLSV